MANWDIESFRKIYKEDQAKDLLNDYSDYESIEELVKDRKSNSTFFSKEDLAKIEANFHDLIRYRCRNAKKSLEGLVFGGLVLAIIATIIGRRVLYKENSYTKKEWNSLTKRYHDAVMYAMFPFLVVLWCVPGYCFGFRFGKWQILAVGFIGLSVWIAGIVWDVVSKEVPNKFQHQTTGKPIWQR